MVGIRNQPQLVAIISQVNLFLEFKQSSHLKDGIPISDLAQELDVQPSQIHQWINMALTQLDKAFEKPGKRPQRSARSLEKRQAQKIAKLEEKLVDRNEVIAELMEENVKAKKLNGAP